MYDLIYLDTTHGYYDTLNELKNIYYKLNTNQVLCGHDYNSQGVSSAINDLFQYPDIEIYLDGSWSIIKNNRLILKK